MPRSGRPASSFVASAMRIRIDRPSARAGSGSSFEPNITRTTTANPLPPGSYLAMSIGTADFAPEEVDRVAREYAARGMPMRPRTGAEAAEFFSGLDLVDPGIVQVHHWRPDGSGKEVVRDADIAMYGAVAHKASATTAD